MIELLRAVKEVTECGGIDLEFDWSPMSNLGDALSAYVAEIRKRRSESPYHPPFHVMTPEIVVLDVRGECVAASNFARQDSNDAQDIAAALNAYYGYDAQGKDMLEGMGV